MLSLLVRSGKGRALSFAALVVELTEGLNEEEVTAVKTGVTLLPGPCFALKVSGQVPPSLVQPAGLGDKGPHLLPPWLNDILCCDQLEQALGKSK